MTHLRPGLLVHVERGLAEEHGGAVAEAGLVPVHDGHVVEDELLLAVLDREVLGWDVG